MKQLEAASNCSTTHRIGNGNNTKFWHDSWHGTPFRFQFPNLFSEVHNKHFSVSQCRNENGWFLHFPGLTHTAQFEKDLLLLHLQGITITQPPSQDTQLFGLEILALTPQGQHTTLFPTPPAPHPPSRTYGKLKAPLRVSIFAWLMLSNRLTTLDNLTRKGWNLPNMCIMCKAGEETIQHLFRQCPLAIQIRAYIQTAIPAQNPIPDKFLTIHSADLLTDQSIHITARNWEIATSYVLWRERCRRTFSNRFESPMSLVREIKLEINNWFET